MYTLTALVALLPLASMVTAAPSARRYFLAPRNESTTIADNSDPQDHKPTSDDIQGPSDEQAPYYFTVKEATLSPAKLVDPSQPDDFMYADIQIFGLLNDTTVSVNATGFFREGGAGALEVAYPLNFTGYDNLKAEFYEGNATLPDSGDDSLPPSPSSRSNDLIFGIVDGHTGYWDMDFYNSTLWDMGSTDYKLKTPVQVEADTMGAQFHPDLYGRPAIFFNEDHTAITDADGNVLDQYTV